MEFQYVSFQSKTNPEKRSLVRVSEKFKLYLFSTLTEFRKVVLILFCSPKSIKLFLGYKQYIERKLITQNVNPGIFLFTIRIIFAFKTVISLRRQQRIIISENNFKKNKNGVIFL